MQKYFPWVSYICDSGLSYDELVYILLNSVLGMKKEEIKKVVLGFVVSFFFLPLRAMVLCKLALLKEIQENG